MIDAFTDAIRRVTAAPLLLVGVYVATLTVTLPMQLARGDTGASRPATTVGAAALLGLPHTFGPGLPAFNRPLRSAVTGLALAAVATWTFLVGGVLDRLARRRRVGGAAFLVACRHHFWPLMRLAVLAGALYWLLFGVLDASLSDDLPGATTPGVTIAPTDPVRIALYGLFGASGVAIGLLVDYARVRTVVEDRRSMVGALVAGCRFVCRRPAAVAGLWLLNTALVAAILAGCALMTPVATAAGPTPWGSLLVGQVCLAARLFTTLVAYASQAAYFQDQLAHRTYVARARVTAR